NRVFQAIFYNLDDTLCVVIPVAMRARRQAFEELVQPLVSMEIEAIDKVYKEVFAQMLELCQHEPWRSRYLKSGEPTRTETMRRLLERLGIEDLDLAKQLSSRYAHLREEYLTLFEDALPTLTTLRPHFALGVITNGPADVQQQEIERLGLKPWLDVILIEGELGIGKPDPRIFQAALQAIGVKPEQALFVGNSWENDIQGALGVGMHAVWLNRDGVPRQEGNDSLVAEIRTLFELPPLLGVAPTLQTPPKI
ncbi:MAG: HAD family hydrolase, partial [candidate division WOR-3 bacterium]